jgi:hypothetical protein
MLHLVAVLVLSGAEFLGPPLSVRASPAAQALIEVDPAHVGLVVGDSDSYATWADERRSEGLSATPQSSSSKDIWVRHLFTQGAVPFLLCASPASAIAPDLVFANGKLTVAYRTGAGLPLHSRYHLLTQTWENGGGCGRPIADGGAVVTGGPCSSPTGPANLRSGGHRASWSRGTWQ